MFTVLLYLVILACGFPAGYVLARMCKDEIKKWRARLIWLSIVCLALAVAVSFVSYDSFEYKTPVIVALFFIIITCLMIVWRSHSRH